MVMENRDEYYYRKFEKEWNLINYLNGETHFSPSQIYAEYNPSLTFPFINYWKILSMRKKENFSIFFSENYSNS